jgi:hypothetical protein
MIIFSYVNVKFVFRETKGHTREPIVTVRDHRKSAFEVQREVHRPSIQLVGKEQVRKVLKKVFEKQSEYEFRHIGDVSKKLNVHSMDIYQQLNLLIHEFKRMDIHPLQRDITD